MLKKTSVLKLFGGVAGAARAAGVSHQAVSKWPDVVPKTTEKRLRRKIMALAKEAGWR